MLLRIIGLVGIYTEQIVKKLRENGPFGATLHEVSGTDSPLLDVACELFKEVFPEDTRYIPYVRACALQQCDSHPYTFDHVWLIEQGGEWVGLRVFSYIKTRNFGHGAYIGFRQQYRGSGLGKWLVMKTLAQLDEDAHRFGFPYSLGYLVEVERPIDSRNAEERAKDEQRLRFHKQCGGIVFPVSYTEPVMIKGVDYLQPADLVGEEPRPMHLVLIPSTQGASQLHLDLVDLVEGLYYDVYRLPKGHDFVKNAISHLTEVK